MSRHDLNLDRAAELVRGDRRHHRYSLPQRAAHTLRIQGRRYASPISRQSEFVAALHAVDPRLRDEATPATVRALGVQRARDSLSAAARRKRLWRFAPGAVVVVPAFIGGAIEKAHGRPNAGLWPTMFIVGWLLWMAAVLLTLFEDRLRGR